MMMGVRMNVDSQRGSDLLKSRLERDHRMVTYSVNWETGITSNLHRLELPCRSSVAQQRTLTRDVLNG